LVLFFGRITRKKGLDLLVEAFRAIAEEFPDTQLVVSGPFDDQRLVQELCARIREWRLEDRVTFTGLLTGQQRFAPLVDAEVFVLPSYSENFGMAVVEAMLCGLPVIVSTGVGISDAIQKNDAGLVVQPTAVATAAAIRRILTEPALREQCIAAGGAYARESFSHLKVGERLIAYYERIIANH
jgi:glycosyltransferase involved in cell wall biosynthesis